MKPCQVDGQHETLTNVVVEVSGDPCALPLLRLNHPAIDVWQGRFRQLTVISAELPISLRKAAALAGDRGQVHLAS